MRTFEIVLLVVNLVSLGLSGKQQPRQVWLGIAGVNLGVCLIHGLYEGFRYQMVFSYLFVVVLTVYLAASATFLKAKPSKALKIIAGGVGFFSLGISAFLAYALPVFTLPEPTGNYPVGIKYVHLVDQQRTDPFLDTTAKPRELMVKIYYPAQRDDTKPFSPYFRNSRALIRLFTTHNGLPAFVFDHLSLVQTHAKEDLQISDAQPRYPVILFSHGAGTTMEVQTAQSEDLASHGYLVVAIDHTYASVGTVFPERVVSGREATTDFKTAEPAEIITQIMADDARFVIEQLTAMNQGQLVTLFQGKLDLQKIGAIGHSVGGAVAYNLAINEPRVKAAIDLDGTVFITPPGKPEAVAPLLMLANDQYHIQAIKDRRPLMSKLADLPADEQAITRSIYGSEEAYNAAYTKAQQNIIGLSEVLKASGSLFTIEGSDHMKFTDIGLFIGARQLRELIGIRGTTDPATCLEITKALTLAFFDQHVKGEANAAPEALVTRYPQLKKVD
ncbi:MAG: dienelactone hydrolase family protein, partial [Chloroflexi bacterium]|nr:dienelactone hydrolase family protein [Chloroflexota bacterium]